MRISVLSLASIVIMLLLIIPGRAEEKLLSGIIALTVEPVTVSASAGARGREAVSGDPVYLNEHVRTGPDHGAEILLKDQSSLTLGPDANIVIDRFVYDPDRESSLLVSIRKGGFKFVSGKIANSRNGSMQLNLPNVTAAIRGTSGVGRVYSDGRVEMALLSGQIEFTDDLGSSIDLVRSGWGVTITSDGGVSTPAPLDESTLNGLINGVSLDPDKVNAKAGDGDAVIANDGAIPFIRQYVFENLEITEDGKAKAEDIVKLLRQERALLDKAGIDLGDLDPEGAEGISIDVNLLDYVLAGGEPRFMSLIDTGSGYKLGNPGLTGEEANLFSEVYAGSVTWSGSGLVLTPNNDLASDGNSARGDYSVTLNYDTLGFSGQFSVYDIALGGRQYADTGPITLNAQYPASSADETIYNKPNFDANGDLIDGDAGQDENGNGLLDPGESLDHIHLGSGTVLPQGGGDTEALASFSGGFGSIAQGNTAADGELAGITIEVVEIDKSDPANPQFTPESVSGTEYSLGESD